MFERVPENFYPERIVSLVPSITETLFAIGLGERVVGVTDWCVFPKEQVAALPKVGGTKNPTIKTIISLAPDLVIANHEENRRIDVERIEDKGIAVWVTYPKTVQAGVTLISELGKLGASTERVEALRVPIWKALEEASWGASGKRRRVFCPIWRDPWMTINRDTYIHDMISICGGVNVFGDYSESRYPKITEQEIANSAPDVVLLPDEPYRFTDAHREEVMQWDIPAAAAGRVHLVDGTHISWYGVRIGEALRVLSGVIRS